MKAFMILMGPEGPEGLEEVPADFKERMFEDKLTGNTETEEEMKRLSSAKFAMNMRARLNNHRNIYVYLINVDADLTKEEFFQMCLDTPKEMNELIKMKGQKL